MCNYILKQHDYFKIEHTVSQQKLAEKTKEFEHLYYIASHDLNEPLRTVNSFIEIVKEEYHNPKDENLNMYFSFIDNATKRMQLIIRHLFNYSNLGKNTKLEKTNINQLIEEVTVDLSSLITAKKATFQVANFPEIDCYPTELKQVFQNLISNAIKFQHKNNTPKITINYQDKKAFHQFCITDNGIGIEKGKENSAFKIFTKLNTNATYKGLGIGLTFCKRIIEIHKGKIWVVSDVNKGSKLFFTIQKLHLPD